MQYSMAQRLHVMHSVGVRCQVPTMEGGGRKRTCGCGGLHSDGRHMALCDSLGSSPHDVKLPAVAQHEAEPLEPGTICGGGVCVRCAPLALHKPQCELLLSSGLRVKQICKHCLCNLGTT